MVLVRQAKGSVSMPACTGQSERQEMLIFRIHPSQRLENHDYPAMLDPRLYRGLDYDYHQYDSPTFLIGIYPILLMYLKW